MLKITRAYLDACGYVDGFFEELLINAIDADGTAVHHVIHAPNGVGKTTILSFLFSIIEPDRRKFLRTEIDRRYKIEHYFLPGRLGVVALEFIKAGVNNKRMYHVLGQVFWLTPSKGEDGEPGLRRFFAFESNDEISLDTLPFRGLSGVAPLRSLDDFTRWAREMRGKPTFFATESPAAWRKHLTSELGIDLKLIEVQRRFCASEGGIAAFLDFKSEQQFLEKIFSFMIPEDAAESVVDALSTGLTKMQGLPRRKDQLKILTQLAEAFALFYAAAAQFDEAEAVRTQDFQRLERLLARLKVEQMKFEGQRNTVTGEIIVKEQELADARQREHRLHGEILFLEKMTVDRRVADAKADVERANTSLTAASRRLRSARAADISRKLSSAHEQRHELEAELDRIERDLAPDRALLAQAGADLHALLERLAEEAERDAETHERRAADAQQQATSHEEADRKATALASDLKAEVERLSARVAEHTRERKQLERSGVLKPAEKPDHGLERIEYELRMHGDATAEIQLQDEQRETEGRDLQGVKIGAFAESRRCEEEAARLTRSAEAGHALEKIVLGCEVLATILPGETKDPYRDDLLDRIRVARAQVEDTCRRTATERDAIAAEISYLDTAGLSSVPSDVAEVTRALKDAGIGTAQPAEYYLAEFKPDPEQALELLRCDPARFGGVFVARLDSKRVSTLAADTPLKLKGPVVVSEATLLDDTTPPPQPGVVFGPFSAARVNKQAAAEEKMRLADVITQKQAELTARTTKLEELDYLANTLRDLHKHYRADRPDDMLRRAAALKVDQSRADQQAKDAVARQQAIDRERGDFRTQLRTLDATITRLTMAKQTVEQFSHRYADIALAEARIPLAAAERQQQEDAAKNARSEAEKARLVSAHNLREATTLRASADAHRANKAHYPEANGQASDRIGTLAYLRDRYRTADHALSNKRDARQATVSLRLNAVKETIIEREQEAVQAKCGLADSDLEPFAVIADLARAIHEAEHTERECRAALVRAEANLTSAQGALGPVSTKISRSAGKRGVTPVILGEFEDVSADLCASEALRREQLLQALEDDIRSMELECADLRTRHNEIKDKLGHVQSLTKRAEDHRSEAYAKELPDLSLAFDELETALGTIITGIANARATLSRLEQQSEKNFEDIRHLIESETFRRLEPLVADNLRRYSHRSAGSERDKLQERIAERIGIIRNEIENQIRDQNACLEQLRLHVIHADDLLSRAARCSKIPTHVALYGGEHILQIQRRLSKISPDIVRNQLSTWLDEQVTAGRIPSDGAALAAEILKCVHAGRSLGIKLLKPKPGAVKPFQPVDEIALSAGEAVTVAMMLYTVIQKMAMDERTDGKNAASGGFLMLDNTYGKSNLLEHIVLQKAMADELDIQLFVTTCSEDKHVLNMFQSITRLAQGERVLIDGQPKYIRVRSADYLVKGGDRAV